MAERFEARLLGWTRWLVAPCLGVLVWMTAPSAAGANEPASAETREGHEGCTRDPAAVERFVRQVFAELYGAYQNQLPGPRGETIRERVIDDLVARTVDIARFAERALGRAWQDASPAQQEAWTHALAGMVHKRYWSRLRDPRPYTMKLGPTRLSCQYADVASVMDHRKTDATLDVVFSLALRDGRWRLYDVTVDSSSLVQTWRSRFRRVYAEGGVEALEREMRLLEKRYPCPRGGCKL